MGRNLQNIQSTDDNSLECFITADSTKTELLNKQNQLFNRYMSEHEDDIQIFQNNISPLLSDPEMFTTSNSQELLNEAKSILADPLRLPDTKKDVYKVLARTMQYQVQSNDKQKTANQTQLSALGQKFKNSFDNAFSRAICDFIGNIVTWGCNCAGIKCSFFSQRESNRSFSAAVSKVAPLIPST